MLGRRVGVLEVDLDLLALSGALAEHLLTTDDARAQLESLASSLTEAAPEGRAKAPYADVRSELVGALFTGAVSTGAVPTSLLLPQVVHAELLAHAPFGQRSGIIARAGARLSAVTSGLDPRGLAVPEPYLLRHRDDYLAAAAAWRQGSAVEFLELSLRAWIAGAQEAEAIARTL